MIIPPTNSIPVPTVEEKMHKPGAVAPAPVSPPDPIKEGEPQPKSKE